MRGLTGSHGRPWRTVMPRHTGPARGAGPFAGHMRVPRPVIVALKAHLPRLGGDHHGVHSAVRMRGCGQWTLCRRRHRMVLHAGTSNMPAKVHVGRSTAARRHHTLNSSTCLLLEISAAKHGKWPSLDWRSDAQAQQRGCCWRFLVVCLAGCIPGRPRHRSAGINDLAGHLPPLVRPRCSRDAIVRLIRRPLEHTHSPCPGPAHCAFPPKGPVSGQALQPPVKPVGRHAPPVGPVGLPCGHGGRPPAYHDPQWSGLRHRPGWCGAAQARNLCAAAQAHAAQHACGKGLAGAVVTVSSVACRMAPHLHLSAHVRHWATAGTQFQIKVERSTRSAPGFYPHITVRPPSSCRTCLRPRHRRPRPIWWRSVTGRLCTCTRPPPGPAHRCFAPWMAPARGTVRF